MVDDAERAVLCDKLEQYEGRVEHMYLDTRGYVTVGVGHLLADEGAATSLPFVRRVDGVAVEAEQIINEYRTVKSLPSGLRAAAYAADTQLILTAETIARLTDKHITTFESELKNIYGETDFDSFPQPVRLALFDMIFNLGATKLNRGFPSFNGCIGAHQWTDAAQESHRRGISDARNRYVFDLLSQA